MESQKIIRSCPRGECTWNKAVEAAKNLGFYEELVNGRYSCCQVIQWYEEQWQAWYEAGLDKPWYVNRAEDEEDSNPAQVPVYVRKRHNQRKFGF